MVRVILAVFLLAGCQSIRLEGISRQINDHVEYVADEGEYFQTPDETRNRGAGDCDDIAILKRDEFIRAGVAARDVILVIVKLKHSSRYHMLVKYNGVFYDSIIDTRGTYSDDFTVVYEFNEFNTASGDGIVDHVNKHYINMLKRAGDNAKIHN